MTSRYASDLTDDQWGLISHLLVSKYRRIGRPRVVNVRRVFDAILYVLENGIKWRNLPHDFPHWRTVFGYFKTWRHSGKLRYIMKRLHQKVRVASGAHKYPVTARIDSQSVRTFKMSAIEKRGYDGGKRIKGRKRHLAVDSLGIPIAIKITPANVNDKAMSRPLLLKASKYLDGHGIDKIYADGGYVSYEFEQWCKDNFNAEVVISGNPAQEAKRFIPVPKRWVVERSFAWVFDSRRLIVDHERKPSSSIAMIRLRFIQILLRRLAA